MYYNGDFVDYRQMPGYGQIPSGYGQVPGYPSGFGQMPGYGQVPGGFGQVPGGFGQMPGFGGYPPGGPGTQQLAQQVLAQVLPLVQYAQYEQQVEGGSLSHAILEVAAIAYLMGRGLPFPQARRIVETWEVGEKFPGFER